MSRKTKFVFINGNTTTSLIIGFLSFLPAVAHGEVVTAAALTSAIPGFIAIGAAAIGGTVAAIVHSRRRLDTPHQNPLTVVWDLPHRAAEKAQKIEHKRNVDDRKSRVTHERELLEVGLLGAGGFALYEHAKNKRDLELQHDRERAAIALQAVKDNNTRLLKHDEAMDAYKLEILKERNARKIKQDEEKNARRMQRDEEKAATSLEAQRAYEAARIEILKQGIELPSWDQKTSSEGKIGDTLKNISIGTVRIIKTGYEKITGFIRNRTSEPTEKEPEKDTALDNMPAEKAAAPKPEEQQAALVNAFMQRPEVEQLTRSGKITSEDLVSLGKQFSESAKGNKHDLSNSAALADAEYHFAGNSITAQAARETIAEYLKVLAQSQEPTQTPVHELATRK